MRTLSKIARAELSILFFSPIAWFLLIVFLIQCGIEYTNKLENFLIMQELGGGYKEYVNFMTSLLFPNKIFGIFHPILDKLFLYLPLITMGLISRETSSGTIKLLYSSPVKVREIVLGKFLAMMVFNFVMILIMSIVLIVGLFHIEHADKLLLLSGLLGFYLLLCTYAAIGLFMSCLSNYQVVAAISTFAILAVLNFIGGVGQENEIVRGITNSLSIAGRADNMINGLINTRDLLYFTVIVTSFLTFSIYRLEDARDSRPWLRKLSRYMIMAVFALLIGYFSSRPTFIAYWDVTATQTNTLTPQTQELIRKMNKGPIEITTYVNLFHGTFWDGRAEERNADQARWEPYTRFKPDITMRYIYYYDSIPDPSFYRSYRGMSLRQIAVKLASAYKIDISKFKTPDEIHKMVDLRSEMGRYVMKIDYLGKSTFLRVFDDFPHWPFETEVGAALKRLTSPLPKIAFIQGELERSPDKIGDRDYKKATSMISFRQSLINQGFNFESVNPAAGQTIPKDIVCLIIADPREQFSTMAKDRIKEYIASGGNLLIAGEPGKQEILNSILEPLGVKLNPGILVQESEDYAPDLILSTFTIHANVLSKDIKRLYLDSSRISMPGSASLSYKHDGPFNILPILVNDSKKSWLRSGHLTVDSARVKFDSGQGDKRVNSATAVIMTRTIGRKQQRIMVSGDADFFSNSELSRSNVPTGNLGYYPALLSWFTYGQFPIDGTRPPAPDHQLNILGKNLPFLRILLIGVFPGILLLAGSIVLIRRKRN